VAEAVIVKADKNNLYRSAGKMKGAASRQSGAMTAVVRRNGLTAQVMLVCGFAADTAEIAAVVTLCYIA